MQYRNNLLPSNSIIVGYARSKMSQEEFHRKASSHIKTIGPEQEKKLKEFLVMFYPRAEC